MARKLDKLLIAVYAILVFALSSSGRCSAQSSENSRVFTDSQRWLPFPNSSPMQPNGQARYLSQLRDRLNSEQSKKVDSTRLSNAQVESLMEAMRQFGDNLPSGLTAESLDAIPPELISKALSDPELVRQAKELAEKYAKKGRSNPTGDQSKPVGAGPNKLSPAIPDAELKQKPEDPRPPDTKQKDAPDSQSKVKDDNFKELMGKLQDIAEGKNVSGESMSQNQPESFSGPLANSNKESSKTGSPPIPEQPAPSTKSGAKQPSLRHPALRQPAVKQQDSTTTPNGLATSRTKPSSSGGEAIAENRASQLPQRADDTSNKQSSSLPKVEPRPFESTPGQPQGLSGQPQGPSNTGHGSASISEPNSKTSIDIKMELERRGFGPTLQKLVEEAQRKSQSTRGNTTPQNPITKPTIAPDSSNRTVRATNSPRPQEPSPRPSAPESAFAKGIQQTGKYLNNLWMQIAKNDLSPAIDSASPSTAPQASAPQEAFSLPNPFNVKALEYLVGLVALGAIAFFVLRFRSRSEQEKRVVLEAQWAPKIDEIRTREDVVRAFHALAKQRLQATQAWWTCGYVTHRFEQSLPQHTPQIRTLAGLYEKARYFPMEYDLTVDQIENAKHALKQCKG